VADMTDAYIKAYEREKNARLASEKLLDEKTREVQSSIEMIQLQCDDLMYQMNESEYLLAVARLTQNDKGLASIVSAYLQASINFIGGKVGRYSYVKGESITSSPVMGTDQELPRFSTAIYEMLYSLNKREIIEISRLGDKYFEKVLSGLGISRIALVPIMSFGRVSTVCEIYLPKDVDFNSALLDQCEVSAYQISSILENNINKKKLEKSYIEIKNSHKKLQQAQSQLVQSEKLASLGQLAAGVAHEINNPIGFVMSNIGTLKEYSTVIEKYLSLANELVADSKSDTANTMREMDDQENFDFLFNDIKDIISDCDDGLIRIKDIVANLKSFSRLDTKEQSLFDINVCIEGVIKVVWNELKYKVELTRTFSNNLPLIRGHEGQIGQVIMNILINAAHAIEVSGEIVIETKIMNGMLLVTVSDTGKGMSKRVQEKIFDPFFTTKSVDKGTGLGLSVSYGIIESHGGEINLTSTEGKGTVFEISLPIEA
jgi:signal transduction histidine kinase